MPCKHGLGYKRLIRSDNGPALFGAWCALIQVVSRHKKPRQGYCTDTGLSDGVPYTATDIELLTDIPATIIEKMLQAVSSKYIGWVDVTESKDTIGIPQETIVPSNSDLDLDLDSKTTLSKLHSDFLERFNEASGKKCRVIDAKTKRQLSARLKDGYTVDEIIKATENASKDVYHKDHRQHLTPEFITRADKLQKWLGADAGQKIEEKPEITEADKYRDWAMLGEYGFEGKHGMTHLDYADKIRVDLADMTAKDFGMKYKRCAKDAREDLNK